MTDGPPSSRERGGADTSVGARAINRNGSTERKASPPASDDRGKAPGFLTVNRLVEVIIVQSTILTGLLFYFGWAQASANLGHFGVDVSILQLSVTDFLLRSVPVFVVPFFNAALYVITATTVIYVAIQIGPVDCVFG